MKRRSVCFPDELDMLLLAHAKDNHENISETLRRAVEKHVTSPDDDLVSDTTAQQFLILQVGFIVKAFADTVDKALVRDALRKANLSAEQLGLSPIPGLVSILETQS